MTVDVLDTCAQDTPARSQALTINNLRYSFVNTSLFADIKANVQASVAEAAGIALADVTITNVTDVTTGVKFEYLLQVVTTTACPVSVSALTNAMRACGVVWMLRRRVLMH